MQLQGKRFLITGVANKKSVAYHSAKVLQAAGAELIFSVQHDMARAQVEKLFPGAPVFLLDVESQEQIDGLPRILEQILSQNTLDGILHSIAFANFSDPKPFHQTSWRDYAQADRIGHFSLIAISNAIKDFLAPDASVVAISISDTRATNYGYMGPIKAALDATVAYLAKSFSSFSRVRFNVVQSGPLKTSASAGIPNYVDNYLFAEKLTLRKRALQTGEVANVVAFLLSPLSSGINASGIVVDAGMSCNTFDESVVGENY